MIIPTLWFSISALVPSTAPGHPQHLARPTYSNDNIDPKLDKRITLFKLDRVFLNRLRIVSYAVMDSNQSIGRIAFEGNLDKSIEDVKRDIATLDTLKKAGLSADSYVEGIAAILRALNYLDNNTYTGKTEPQSQEGRNIVFVREHFKEVNEIVFP